MPEWREDVKKVLLKAGLQNLPITFLFSDTQVPLPQQRAGLGGLDTTPSEHSIPEGGQSFMPSSLSARADLRRNRQDQVGPQMGKLRA